MTNDLAPYQAVLLASYGGPNGPEDVLPFMRNATAGRGVPDSRLLEVSKHYELFGGRSPINELNARLLEHLRAELRHRGADVPVVIGNRNWHPFFAEAASELAAQGVQRVVAVTTSAYRSYSSCRQYGEDLAAIATGLQIDKVGPYAETDGFVNAHARSLVDAIKQLRAKLTGEQLRVLFVTHSIPVAMNTSSGPGDEALRYDAMHLRVAKRVAQAAGLVVGEKLEWEMVYCSRSGPPHIPWLEPDVNDRLAELADTGVAVVTAPIGFINDHMEVAFDLDIEAAQSAADLGISYQRAATINDDPEFVAMLVDLLFEQAAFARGEIAAPAASCGMTSHGSAACCAAPRRRGAATQTGQASS